MLTKQGQRRVTMLRLLLLTVIALLVAAGCSNMEDQAKLDEPYQESEVFGTAARDILPEAVPVGFERADEAYSFGTENGELVNQIPVDVTADMLATGQARYNQFCSPCHGMDGSGEGVIALEGYPQPASYHTDRLRNAPDGVFFQAITNGVGTMFSYAGRVNVDDRWAIVAYIRALQLSQHATLEDLPAAVQAELLELE